MAKSKKRITAKQRSARKKNMAIARRYRWSKSHKKGGTSKGRKRAISRNATKILRSTTNSTESMAKHLGLI